ncbi:hypothetical protein SAMN06265795_10835 [Noviherbaspirillum humi]|uniref:Uncharacterized protein n=1 Tax=Noviherbaspirillum humi TaxID=1688639 RepID=A0A239HZS3_9BURK|nr:hypothetical protein [Noviherbaspirillum humi]SNS86795.1 hypothetical protein SAMN06265795_10835 [Noviherbaspirillum humi]
MIGPNRTEPAGKANLGDFVREYVLPYNTLFAFSSFTAAACGYLSSALLVLLALTLAVAVCQLVVLDLWARKEMAELIHARPGRAASVAQLLWRSPQASLFSSSVFWAIVAIAGGVGVYAWTTAIA